MSGLPAQFSKYKLVEPEIPKRPRAIITTEGLEATGKTNLMKTCTRPLLMLNFDWGTEGVIENMTEDGSGVYIKTFRVPEVINQDDDIETVKGIKSLVNDAVTSGFFRTTFIDTGDDLWQIIRRAEFGKLEKVPPMRYGAVNRFMQRLFRLHKENCVNLVISHKITDEYKTTMGENNKEISLPTGKKKRSGWKGIEFETDVHLRLWKGDLSNKRDPLSKFHARFIKCRTNTEVEGEELDGSEINFSNIVELAYPYWEAEDWQ